MSEEKEKLHLSEGLQKRAIEESENEALRRKIYREELRFYVSI
jgi:hypothetical protein